jgi:gamma-glutamyltranspeptidase / glutathione hydrolase
VGQLKAFIYGLFGALVLAPVSQAQSAPDPIVAGYARTQPVVAKNGMVVAQEAIAARIGVEILKKGGNAVDAAVATGFALAVSFPRAGNLGGGGFMLVHLAQSQKTIAIDYRETAPASMTKTIFLDEAGKFVPAKSQSSGLAVGVPGTVAGLYLAYEKYGSGKFEFSELVRPAMLLARDGIKVEGDLISSLAEVKDRLARYPSSRAIFMHADGTPLREGDILVQPDLATTLYRIVQRGPKGFYESETAERIVNAVRNEGGIMSTDDLRDYKAIERDVVRGKYRDRDIVSMPPPSSGGVHIVQILNLLEGFPLNKTGPNSAQTIHLMAESMKLAYADREKWLGDPDFVKNPVAGLVLKKYAQELRKKISPDRATPSKDIKAGDPLAFESDQTTHFSVIDAQGNAVANTYTLNFSYGLGMVAAGTGVMLNNELDDFAATAGAPNAFGLMGGDANAPGPRKRPLSSMSPTMVFRNGELELVTGSPGGSRIITTVLQVISNIIDHNMNVAEASEAARVHHQLYPDELRIERGISPDTVKLLEQKGHVVREHKTMGSTQSIMRVKGEIHGAADTRQMGTAAIGY